MNIKLLFPYEKYTFNFRQIKTRFTEVRKNDIYICLQKGEYDGHAYIDEAIKNGCILIIGEKDLSLNHPYIKVLDTKVEYARINNLLLNRPDLSLELIGVTGTDGKTTTASLLKELLPSFGYIGTNGITYLDKRIKTHNTTPDNYDINRYLSDMVDHRIKGCSIEVSSHGIMEKRVGNLHFKTAIFTNLSQEHLDYHETIERYFEAKRSFFEGLDEDTLSIINIDDEYGKKIYSSIKSDKVSYSLKEKADIRGKIKDLSLDGTTFDLIYKRRCFRNLKTNLVNEYNIYNLLPAIYILFQKGYSIKDIRLKIKRINQIEGRMEIIRKKDFIGIIDFAHTPNALYNLLKGLNVIINKNLILVMGVAGNKDKTKRSLMGKIATSLADFVIFTEEDSYDEPLDDILDDLTKDIEKENYIVIKDRTEAIRHAVRMHNAQDAVIITGKGNEKTMSKNNIVLPYNDLKTLLFYYS